MKVLNNFSVSINTVLKNLIEEKSRRDKVKFTSYQLASILSMPRSIISKLTHPDESKRIVNPRIETLLKIVEFFKADGFDITIDSLLGINNPSVEVQSQLLFPSNSSLKPHPLYSLNNIKKYMGTAEIKLPDSLKNTLTLYAEEDIEPFFKKGSVFVVDLDAKPEVNNLIAIKLGNSEKVSIKKYYQEKTKLVLKSLNDEKDIILMPTQFYKILGVIVTVNAKT